MKEFIKMGEKEKHKKRHIELHKALDELFADYIGHHPNEIRFTEIPLKELLTWSFEQTKNPTDEKIYR